MYDPSVVFLDVETLRLSTDLGMGWGNIPALGLAVACTYSDSPGHLATLATCSVGKDGRLCDARMWFEPDAADLLAYLAGFERVVGFNSLRFDYRVLDGALRPGPPKPPHLTEARLRGKTVDLWADLRDATGRMVGLDAACRATLGRGKTGNGADAPRLWAAGRRDEVIQYCAADVFLTRDLYLAGLRGPLRYAAGAVTRVNWKVR